MSSELDTKDLLGLLDYSLANIHLCPAVHLVAVCPVQFEMNHETGLPLFPWEICQSLVVGLGERSEE